MIMKLISLIFILFLSTSVGFATETCSRVAIINYQEVLVDTSSNAKGEGLRFYLQKDPGAKALLDEYQQKNKPSIWAATTSTLGSVMVLGGLLQTNDDTSGITNRNTLIYGGLLLSSITYLASKTMQYNNEELLERAVEQYNKRNLPRIYFSPYRDNNSNFSIGVGVQQEF
jgi:hypothetical protein